MDLAPALPLKMVGETEGRIGGYLVVWGGQDRKDLQGEYFTEACDFALHWYDKRPLLYQHGLDSQLKSSAVGVIDRIQADEIGLWAEAQLDLRRRYARTIQSLIEAGQLHFSSASIPHLVDIAEDGQIKRWPIVEGSLTPTPAEPYHTNVLSLKSARAACGLAEANPLEKLLDEELDTLPIPPAKRLPQSQAEARLSPAISVTSPFDSISALDMLHGYILMSANKSFRGSSEVYANALAHKVQQAGWTATKADELSYSTQNAYGDEWVANLWSQEIWRKAREENTILPLFRSIDMPSNPFELPIEGTDPTVYFVPESSDEAQLSLGAANPIPDSKMGSAKVRLEAKKLALRVGFSSELVEDSIVPVLSLYREQALRAILDSIDHLLLNGDTQTAASGNINSDHQAPTAASRYLAFDGLRKSALVTTPTQAVNAAGSISLEQMRTARFKMPMRFGARPADLAWIVDGTTYTRLLGLDEFLTVDKAGALATAQRGEIGKLDGIPVFVSAEMPTTEADGKVGASANTKGQALCVYRPGWYVGYRRRIAVSVDYIPYYDSYQLTATVRLAFMNADPRACSVLYNITV